MGLPVKNIIRMGVSQLERSGNPDAETDAELLLRYLFCVDKMGLYKLWGKEMDDDQCDQYFTLVETRASGTPLQYIIGTQEFMGFPFIVNENVMIPRQDTETLVEEAASMLEKAARKGQTVLDLCCGCGAIGISLARLCESIKVTASDISRDALAVARQNAKKLLPDKKITFEEGDLFAPFYSVFRTVQFDMIVANPPYIKSGVIPTLQTEIKNHEPLTALDGGLDGLDFYRRILAQAPKHLKKGGALLLEIGHDQAAAIREIVAGLAAVNVSKKSVAGRNRLCDVTILQDLAGNDRVAVVKV